MFTVASLAGCASLVLRFRRARGEERQQLKWFAYAAALLVASNLVGSLLLPGGSDLGAAFTIALLPIAAGIAILRYRLYDIDRLINRTLVYGCSPACSLASTPAWSWSLGRCSAGLGGIRRAGWWRARLWRWRHCSSRPGVVSRRSWTGASTVASTTPPRPWKRSAFDSAKRWTWARSRPSCWPSPTRPCSQRRLSCGYDHQHRCGLVVHGRKAEPTLTRLDPLHAMQFRLPPLPQVRSWRPARWSSRSDRDCPLDTAGDRCLWHVGGTAGETGDGSYVAAMAPAARVGEARLR